MRALLVDGWQPTISVVTVPAVVDGMALGCRAILLIIAPFAASVTHHSQARARTQVMKEESEQLADLLTQVSRPRSRAAEVNQQLRCGSARP